MFTRDNMFLLIWSLIGANAIAVWVISLMLIGIRNNWWWRINEFTF